MWLTSRPKSFGGKTVNFSVTEIQGYKRCHRLSNLSSFNAQGLTRLSPPIYFSTGTIWHAAHERWLNEPNKHFVQCTLEAAQDEIKAVEARYFDRLGFPPSKMEMASVWESVEVLPEMANNYQQVWGQPLPDEYHCIAPEQTLIVPVPGTEHNLELTLDALIQNVDTGDLLVLERKTYSRRPNERTLQNDNQFLRYVWGAREAGLGPVVGIAYDGAWKRKAPTKKDMSLNDMFLRTTLLRNEFEIEHETQCIRNDVLEMANDEHWIYCGTTTFDLEEYPPMHPSYNNPWNGCVDCQFRDPCELERKGKDFLSVIQTQFGPRQKMGHALLQDEDD